MKDTEWADKTVVVIGAGRSGKAASHLLLDLGARVIVTDLRPSQQLDGIDSLVERGATVALGDHPENLWRNAAAAIISPGIALSSPPAQSALHRGVPVLAEIELAAPFIDAPVIGITGSNGKSTVTSMVGDILQAGGLAPAVCGNIGLALSFAVRQQLNRKAVFQAYVVELSSFQCEAIDHFHPHLAAILNLTADHLDRHGTFDSYTGAKLRLLKNCTVDDWFVYNQDDGTLRERLPATPARRVPFSHRPPQASGKAAWVDEGKLWWCDGDGPRRQVMPVTELNVIGPHNQENACAAAALGALAGVPLKKIAAALSGFKGLEHRMEACGEIRGVRCINDSKATNVDSTMAALAGFHSGVWLILGGRDKGADFQRLRASVAERVDRVLLIGEATDKIATALHGSVPLVRCETLERAVSNALASADVGDVLLLSPACTSFDQYASFEARGNHFKRLVTSRRPAARGGQEQTAVTTGDR
ncbi:MAG: UDP-N-acetylmuramoyl-L-alanine--D-glutamate ligase [Acidobacteriota bacterium]